MVILWSGDFIMEYEDFSMQWEQVKWKMGDGIWCKLEIDNIQEL